MFVRKIDLPHGKSKKKFIPQKTGKQPYGTWSLCSTFNYITLAVFCGM